MPTVLLKTLENSRRFNIAHCVILDSDGVGLFLKNVRDSLVSGCLIRDDREGATSTPLKVEGGEGNVIEGNLLGAPYRATPGAR